MAIFRNSDTITLSMLDFLRIVQPDLDTKPGSVARELFIDAPASELAKLYIELRNIANLQSFASAKGNDLDKLARNFGQTRGTGSNATGVIVLTASSLESDIPIVANSVISAQNGFTYRTLATSSMSTANSSVYKANAIRLRTDLDLAGISDQFAIEVAAEATSPGAGGNVGKFGIISHNIPGISNVTNLQSFTGGSSSEGDDAFRARVLSVFSGSNTGTALGYINALLKDQRIQDVLTVQPGDPLMIRDGSDVAINDDGEKIIISIGTGGKVDLYIDGQVEEEFAESYIYKDLSGKNDPTDSRNDFTLGQRGISTLLDFQQRRRLAITDGQMPFQPVDELLSVSGSLSGPNFIQATTNSAGVKTGSFELVKDTGAFSGSPFGFDKLRFISGEVSLTDEVLNKSILNSQDPLDFTDVTLISNLRQLITVNNEHPTVSSSDRSLLTLAHTPISSVERVANLTTGERYTIANQNPNGVAGEDNADGIVQISGNTLPTLTDILQTNYLWNAQFDENIDFDNLANVNVLRTTEDSVDWGFSNRVVAEEQTVLYSSGDGYHIILTHPASAVINVNTILEETVTNVSGKLTVSSAIINIVTATDTDGLEVYNTALNDGSFSGSEITLPTDSLLFNSETATVRYNQTDIYSPDGYDTGTFDEHTVRLPDGSISVGATVYADYIANILTLLPTTDLSDLPISGSQNSFTVAGDTIGDQPVSNIWTAGEIERNLRFAPSYLRLNIQGIPSRGRLTIKGTSFIRVDDIITVRSDGLTIDLSESIKSFFDISTVPSSMYVSYVAQIERVTISNDDVSSIDYEFDILNYELLNIEYSNGLAVYGSDLTSTEIKLQATEENTSNNPTTGQRLRVTYYVSDSSQIENITITSADPVYTKYRYVFVENISVASGFVGISGTIAGSVSISAANQPISGTQYFASYDYTAPKEGERLTISYLYNKLISESTINIEKVRPITADVLIRAAVALEIDVSIKIVPTSEFVNDLSNLEQSVNEAIVSLITTGGLEEVLDASDVINAVYAVSGVDRAIITLFNRSGETGIQKSISAEKNEYLSAGVITVEPETR